MLSRYANLPTTRTTSTIPHCRVSVRCKHEEGGREILDLLQMQFLNGDVTAGGVLKVLQGLGPEAFVTERRGDGLVLGFDSPSGAASMVDIPLGNVRSHNCSSTLFATQSSCFTPHISQPTIQLYNHESIYE